MDIETVVARHFKNTLEIPCFVVIPTDRPKEFAFVEITTASGNRFKYDYDIAVQAWAQTRARACELAQDLAEAAQDLDVETNIFAPKAEPPYPYTDPTSKTARYQFVLHLTVCK